MEEENEVKNQGSAENKSIYQTFIDVGSIFSKNHMENTKKQKSRFIQEELEEESKEDESEEDYSIFPSIFGDPPKPRDVS